MPIFSFLSVPPSHGTAVALAACTGRREKEEKFTNKHGRDEKMKRKTTWTCFLIACLLLAWLSPVGYADPGRTGKDSRININKASVEELVELPRVGQAVAERIVAFREENGPFKKVEDLKSVRGIGDKVFDQIRPNIRVD
jgi:comEA protein